MVIDPGHGGVDPGAIGVSGAYEKDIALIYSRAIAQELRKTGNFDVELTRDRDIFLPLRDRLQHARTAGADLFLSLIDAIGAVLTDVQIAEARRIMGGKQTV